MEKKLNFKKVGKTIDKQIKKMFQILMLGDCEVGKTSIIKRILNDEFSELYNKTNSFEFSWNNFEIDNEIYTLQIWDITGKENFNLISENFYKKCNCAFFVYSIDNKNSLINLKERLKVFRNYSSPNTLLFLVGNKSDNNEKRETSYGDGINFKMENNLNYFFEISAKNGEGISEIIEIVLNTLINNLDENNENQSDENIKLIQSHNSTKDNINSESSRKKYCFQLCGC